MSKTFVAMEKIYFLPTCRTCPHTCNFCEELGFKAKKNKTRLEIMKALKKAQSGEYKYVLLPCNSLFHFEFRTWIAGIVEAKLIPLVQINLKSLNTLLIEELKELSKLGCSFSILLDEMDEEKKDLLKELENFDLIFATVLNKKIPTEKIIKSLSEDKVRQLSFYLPLKKKRFDGNYSCYQLNKKMIRLKRKFPDITLKPLEGLDQFDSRISPDLELEPVYKPLLTHSISAPDQIKISVIIPAYNNQNYIQNNLRHLALQTLSKVDFEVIVINDGSSDATGERIKEILSVLPPMNYKYFYVPRPGKRFMGDAQFRAGIARNLGVKNASGKYISFLDADMITPPDYLENLLSLLVENDLVQTQRHYLKGKMSSNLTNYADLDPDKDTFVPEKGYWHDFYNNPKDWNEIEACWKYVCTYSLTLSKDLFKQIGWFRKTYMFYGFEDTDLGYRLYKQNKKFKLSSMRVYHLFQHDDRSEYSNSDYIRQNLLSKTAKIFYRNYLDDEIFLHLQSLINDGPGLEDLIPGPL